MKAPILAYPGAEHHQKSLDGIPIKVYADRPQSLRQVLRDAVSISPEKVALIYQDQQVTYREFSRRANRVTAALQKLCGVGKG